CGVRYLTSPQRTSPAPVPRTATCARLEMPVERRAAMWKCPACSTPIRRELMAAGDVAPQPDRLYRCSICRLELVLDRDGTRMIIAPRDRERAESSPD